MEMKVQEKASERERKRWCMKVARKLGSSEGREKRKRRRRRKAGGGEMIEKPEEAIAA